MFRNNKIYLTDRNGKKRRGFNIFGLGLFSFPVITFGLCIKFKGKNSTVELGLPLAKFSKSKITLANNSTVKIDSSWDKVKKLKISMADSQKCSIGKNFFTWGTEIIFSKGKGLEVNINEECMFSKNILIRPSDGHSIFDSKTGETLNHAKSISIGRHTWIAGDVTVFKGANIADDCIIGHGSIVTKPCETPNSIYAGIPAKFIKTGINWKREAPDT